MKEITLPATVENLTAATSFVEKQLESMDCPMKAQMQINIAIDEIFSNIAYYAYTPNTGNVTIRFELQDAPRSAVITFMDEGVPYDPLTTADPDTTLSVQEREIGGLGIFMVRKIMDEVRYHREGRQNILTLRKKI